MFTAAVTGLLLGALGALAYRATEKVIGRWFQ